MKEGSPDSAKTKVNMALRMLEVEELKRSLEYLTQKGNNQETRVLELEEEIKKLTDDIKKGTKLLEKEKEGCTNVNKKLKETLNEITIYKEALAKQDKECEKKEKDSNLRAEEIVQLENKLNIAKETCKNTEDKRKKKMAADILKIDEKNGEIKVK